MSKTQATSTDRSNQLQVKAAVDARDWTLVAYMSLALFGAAIVSGAFFLSFAALFWLVLRVVDVEAGIESVPPIARRLTATVADLIHIAGPVLATCLVFAGLLWLYRWRQRLFWRRFEAHTVTPEPELERQMTRIAAAMDVPAPELRVIRTPVSTAMTTGVRPRRTSITVTTGLVDGLSSDELRAVLAHELSHVKHRDVAILTVAMAPAVVASGLWTACTTSPKHGEERSPGNEAIGAKQFEGVGTAVVGLVACVFWFASIAVVSALARYRELAADRAAVQVTGSPSNLAAALSKMAAGHGESPDLRLAELEAFAIMPVGRRAPSNGWQTPLTWVSERTQERFNRRFSLHPSTRDRIDRIQEWGKERTER